MLPVDQITKSLPPMRDDEPSSLRQNIVDEIADHLHCSLRRELLVHGSDEQTAKKQVLIKFGDPSRIARKLWFQAMWSKIMVQRLMIGSMICLMVASMALVALVGWLVQQQQQTNSALLEQMAKLIPNADGSQVQRDSRWNNLMIKVTRGVKDGPGLEGATITVARFPGLFEATKSATSEYSVRLDQSGVADCGYVEPGRYVVDVITPDGEQTNSTFTVHPGRDHVEQIIAPDKLPEMTKVIFQVEGMPTSVMNSHTAFIIEFVRISDRDFADRKWSKAASRPMVGESMPYFLLVPNHGIWASQVPKAVAGTLVKFSINDGPDEWGGDYGTLAANAKWIRLERGHEFSLPEGRYSVKFASVRLAAEFLGPGPRFLNKPNELTPLDAKWKTQIESNVFETHFEWDLRGLVAISGRINEWTITLPEAVIRRLRFDDVERPPFSPVAEPEEGPPTFNPVPDPVDDLPVPAKNQTGTRRKSVDPVPDPSEEETQPIELVPGKNPRYGAPRFK